MTPKERQVLTQFLKDMKRCSAEQIKQWEEVLRLAENAEKDLRIGNKKGKE